MCTLVFFLSTSPVFLFFFFFLQSKGFCWSWGCEADKEHSSGGPRRPFLTHLSVALSPPPSLSSLSPTTSAPLSPFPLDSFSLTLYDSATSYLSVPTIPSSPEMPASVPLTQTHPGALFRSFAISPSLCSHSPSLCWASVCLVKTVESLTSADACDFSQAPEGPRERVLCALTTQVCKEGAGTVFLLQRFLAGCLTSIAALCRFQVKDLGLEEETRLDNKQRDKVHSLSVSI